MRRRASQCVSSPDEVLASNIPGVPNSVLDRTCPEDEFTLLFAGRPEKVFRIPVAFRQPLSLIR